MKLASAHENALDLIDPMTLSCGWADNFPFAISGHRMMLNGQMSYGSIFRFGRAVAVFNTEGGPYYRDLYRTTTAEWFLPVPKAVYWCLCRSIGTIEYQKQLKSFLGQGNTLGS